MATPSAEVPSPGRPPALSFRQRIALAFGAAALLIAATGLISFYALRESVASDRLLVKEARDVIEFGRLRAAIEKKIGAVRGYLLNGDEKFLAEIERWRRDLRTQVESLRRAGLTPKENELLTEIERAEETHQKATEEAIGLKRSGQTAGFFDRTLEAAREELERRLSAYLYNQRQTLEQADSSSLRKNSVASSLVLASGLAAIALTLILALTVTRRLSRLYETEQHDRQVAETARQRLRELIEDIPGGIVWEADAATMRMKFVSRRAQEMLGYPREEALAAPDFWTRLIHVEDRERVLAAAAELLRSGTERQFAHRFLAADGRTVWFQTRVRFRREEGKPTVLLGLSVDITRLKEADEALRLRALQQAAVARLGQEALTETDLTRLFESACRAVSEMLEADFAAVLEEIPERGFLLRAGVGWREGLVGRLTGSGTNTQAGYTLLAGEPVIVADLESEGRFRGEPMLREHGVVSGVSVVIPGTPSLTGVLSAYTRTRRNFLGEDVFFLQSVANVLSAAARRERAERAVQASERRKTAILEGALDAIITMDYEGRVLEFNPAAERMFGFASAHAVGRKMVEMIIPERLREPHREGLARYLLTGQEKILNRRLEMPALRCDGSEFPVELAISRIPGEGPPVFTGFVRDITERNRSEEEKSDLLARERSARSAAEAAEGRAAFLAEASATLASSLDYPTTLSSVARLLVPRIADGCAVDMLDEKGRLRRLVTSHSDPSRVAASEELALRYPPVLGAAHGVGRVVAAGEPEMLSDIPDEALRAVARDEEHYRLMRNLSLVSLMCVPLRTRGRILGAISLASSESGRRFGPEDLAFAQDLAGRASAAIENARLYREAREAVRARDEFLSIASHELKTPLTTLQLQIQGLGRRVRNTRGQPALEALGPRIVTSERQVERLTALINSLLDISRITAGRLDLDLEPVDLAAVVRDATTRFREDLARAGCSLEIQTDGPCVGEWDRIRLEQVVTNLLSNAAKYGASRPIEVKVSADETTAVLTIKDHGIGIPPEHQARIFERFQRAVSDRHYGGLGLGLWIVRQIVEALGGSIRVESEPTVGSTFTVLLPKAALKRRSSDPGS
jgi:PAS domain S-box-containing protein